MQRVAVLLIACMISWTSTGRIGAASTRETPSPLAPVYIRSIRVHGFWRQEVKRLTEKWIPHCIAQMEEGGRGQELMNLVHTAKVLRGESAGQFAGCPWSDAYVYNTIEAICLALAFDPEGDEDLAAAQRALKAKLDEWIPIVLAAQMDDGYIHSYHTVNRYPLYSNIDAHEFYVQGYFIEAGIAHYRITGGQDRRLFDAARRCADQLCENFGPAPKRNWIYGHPGMGIALCRLSRLVDEIDGDGAGNKYAALAKFLFDHRHTKTEHRNPYRQSHLPVVEQAEAVGHAVRATYFYTGIADLAAMADDPAYLQAADRLWDSAVNRKMYITGGVGATGHGEAFAADYDLPNESAYCESCAGCGLAFWADRMHRIHKDAATIDVEERVLYNNVLGAIERTGENFYYQNPLAGSRKRYPWHGCPCCVGNIPRTLLAIKDRMYCLNRERDTLYLDHFVGSDATIADVAGVDVTISQRTEYPWKGDIAIVLQPQKPVEFTVRIRIPRRDESELYTATPQVADDFTLTVNGEPVAADVVDGYAAIARTWTAGDRIDLALPMKIQRVRADERVVADRGRVALQRGPIVFNVEDVDNDGQATAVVLRPEAQLEAVWRGDLLDGVMTIVSEDGRLVAVPNYARLHRGGWSLVWIAERPEMAAPYREPTIASKSKVSTSFETSEGRFDLDAIHDRREPKQSDERGTPLFHWWPHRGTVEWVQYDFEQPATVSAAEVYWYDDRGWGGCRVPDSWNVLYRDGDEWKPVENASGYGVKRDRFNRVTFEKVTTDALRLEVQLAAEAAAGVLEWRVE